MKKEIIKLLKQDVRDLKGLIEYEKYSLTDALIKKQARAISLNLQDHLEDFIRCD